ncbi:hypothetical protein SEVIR_8G073900v4 [Setaria viridis]|uniref:VWFA domain-containing protein n=1 Tax=Setaria viridis TaxID=4556 RepID=A0A4U6TFS5_SETVI|nr:uncharacterized protein LOC117834002 [Setaria viridis]TKV99883.1 hypothetical protein SEVIR_8G073900v2 [Setaria viridis]
MMGVSAALACLLCTLLLSEATTTGAETVKLTTTPIFPQIPRGQTNKDFQVLVRLEAPPAAGHHGRVPIDLAVVLNVGGGTASRLDSVKKAVLFIIRQLHDDDRLAVVGPANNRLFGETATGFLDIRDGRRHAESSVNKLQPRDGHSQQASGLKEAIKMLSELPASSSSRASFIILVTDTKESSRFSKLPREFLKNHPVVHTIGVGAAHDPKALLAVAEESGGTYSFVDDRNDDGIAGAVAVCLSGLKAVAAVGTRLRLEAAAGTGVRVERVESGGYSTALAGDRASGEVTVGALYAGEAKSFIIHLQVPAVPPTSTSVDGAACDKQHLLTASFVVGHGTATGYGDASPPTIQAILTVQRPPAEGIAAAASATLQRVPVPVVMDHIVQFGVLDMVTTFVENEIWELSSITAEVGAAMAAKLQSRWEEFVQARQFWSGLDLGAFEVEISKMVSILAAAGSSGGSSSPASASASTAYILSWLSSYQMQRPTAMGSPSSVAPAFVTLSMQLTVQQTTTILVAAPGNVDGGGAGCPPCECDDACVEPVPPPVFVASGRHDDTYRVNGVYPPVLMDAINQAVNQMYLALVQASNVKRCNSSNGEVPPQPRAIA